MVRQAITVIVAIIVAATWFVQPLLLPQAASLATGAALAQEQVAADSVQIVEQTSTPEAVHTVVRINVRKDAFVASAAPNTNYGRANTLNLGWFSGSLEAARILIEFDISSIPARRPSTAPSSTSTWPGLPHRTTGPCSSAPSICAASGTNTL
jgi:hypothetical protein